MATLFSDAFPEQTNAPGLVSYRASGGVVKVATFAYTVPAGGVNVTTASRLNLFLMPFNARIVRGVIEVTTAFGTGTACNLVAADAATDTTLWGSGGVNLVATGLYEVDRVGRGMLYTSPTDIPAGIRANGGVRIALAPAASATFSAGGTLRGFFLYV
jgi:hypothetical protein